MWDWDKIAKNFQDYLNSDPMVQKFMQEAQETAYREKWTQERWVNYKNAFCKVVFLKAIQSNTKVMDEFCEQIYHELRGEA
jgi:hypothetical protein